MRGGSRHADRSCGLSFDHRDHKGSTFVRPTGNFSAAVVLPVQKCVAVAAMQDGRHVGLHGTPPVPVQDDNVRAAGFIVVVAHEDLHP